MLKMELPYYEHTVLYELSRSRFTDKSFKKRLEKGQLDVLALGLKYVSAGVAGELSTLTQSKSVPPHIEGGDMQTLYKEGLLRKNSEARSYYEKLRLSSPYRICPFCLHRTVKTLDHFLPKEKFGAYAVLPANLVPCCRDCNSGKDQYHSSDANRTLLHPYFDDVDGAQWLGCELNISDGFCTPEFFIDSASIDNDLVSRISSHMEKLELFELYDVEGARELNEMSSTVSVAFDKSGSEAVKDLCESMASSRSKLAENYWRAALWRAASRSSDYCKLSWRA